MPGKKKASVKLTEKEIVSEGTNKLAAFEHLISLYPEGLDVDIDKIREERFEI